MKTTEFEVPAGFELSMEESDNYRIVLVRKKPVFAEKLEDIERPWFVDSLGGVSYCKDTTVNQFKTEKRAKQVLALIQLLAFRDDIWDKQNWKPIKEYGNRFWVVYYSLEDNRWTIGVFATHVHTLQFKDMGTAEYFLTTHKELLDQWNSGI